MAALYGHIATDIHIHIQDSLNSLYRKQRAYLSIEYVKRSKHGRHINKLPLRTEEIQNKGFCKLEID